jgi:hypothetical protein
MSRIESARKAFRISNAWLTAHSEDKDAYVDLGEIVRDESAYLDWVVANDGEDRENVKVLASLDPTAIIIYNTTAGDNIKCRLADENVSRTRQLIGKIVHPLSITHVKAYGTQCRSIELLGFAQSNLAINN